ncbi:hypothetical protein OAN12_05660 [Halioglobus sp.]|nr:hypothetical protein [Halioglobus sp.]
MRSLALTLALVAAICLSLSSTLADVEIGLEERKQRLMESARNVADDMSGFEDYTSYLAPFPARVLIGDEMAGYVLFAQGWHKKELEGRWSDGKSSKIYVKIPPGKQPSTLYIHGRYHRDEKPTRVIVNGTLLSEAPLIHHNIDLPPGLAKNGQLEIEFQHVAPTTVQNDRAPGEGKETRKYEFFLVRLSVY